MEQGAGQWAAYLTTADVNVKEEAKTPLEVALYAKADNGALNSRPYLGPYLAPI